MITINYSDLHAYATQPTTTLHIKGTREKQLDFAEAYVRKVTPQLHEDTVFINIIFGNGEKRGDHRTLHVATNTRRILVS